MTLSFQFSKEVKNIELSRLESFKKIIANPNTQFFHSFERPELLSTSKSIYEKFKTRKTFVHVGIGGSSLGPEMVVNALKNTNCQFIFVNNIDPDELYTQLEFIDYTTSLFYFVSKSGGTAETMSALAIISQFLFDKGVSKSDLKNYFVFATDKNKSELLDLGKELSIDLLEVPSDVGGRFSALTPVGFLPALFAGINIDQLVQGAIETQKICLQNDENNLLLKFAHFLFELKKEQGISQTVFMPYSSKLKSLSFWFTQLWAESLGKKSNKSGEVVFEGFTPIVAYGATDQHSQVQLFMEGPKDKALILIEVENFSHDFNLKNTFESANLKKLAPYTLSQLMKAELYGTLKALEKNSRPFIHLKITQNDAYHLGSMVLFFESLTAMMGDFLNIDPFDQPGVEAGKIYAFEFLNKLK
jgi:glucose-6-phosphate isomerase